MIGGYPKFSTFGATIGVRSPEGREEFLRYHSAAIIVAKDSPAIQRLEEISRSTNVFLIIGVIEKDSLTSGTLYCTVVFVDPDAGLVAKHRKLVPTATERIIWGSGDGSTLPVIEGKFTSILGSKEATNGDSVNARMSAAICW
jgi:predicted amidohydrolase